MIQTFQDYTRCPEEILRVWPPQEFADSPGFFEWEGLKLYGSSLAHNSVDKTETSNTRVPPFSVDEVIDNLRLERYIDNSIGEAGRSLSAKRLVRNAYYALRPLMPVAFRKHLQRIALRGWDKRSFPAFPVDVTVEQLVNSVWKTLFDLHGKTEFPFVWFWPEGYDACCIMTHDVETAAGRDFCSEIMKAELPHRIGSSFEIIPEDRYEVPAEFLDSIRSHGCEVCLHGLNHDGHLFDSEAMLRTRARKIARYARQYGAVGFRSPVMYRNVDLFHYLSFFSYDMSVPNVAHLDPQPGGCCTVMPYFIGNILELPLTTTQDYPLHNVIREFSMDLWRIQLEKILRHHGLASFIIHPDYTIAPKAMKLFRELLSFLESLRKEKNVWIPLPREVGQWWRNRKNMTLVNVDGQWRIEGPDADQARIAYAVLSGNEVHYRIETEAHPVKT